MGADGIIFSLATLLHVMRHLYSLNKLLPMFLP